jgi:hypothetical protein
MGGRVNSNWDLFAEFARQEIAAHGPDPQLPLIEELVRSSGRASPQEFLWAAGCYCAQHSVTSTYLVWKYWRPEEVYFDSVGGEFEAWLVRNWKYLPIHRHMKHHKMPEKRAECLHDFARYALEWSPARTNRPYDLVWKDAIDSVKFFGRYMAIKYLEMIGRWVEPSLQLQDVRSKGGWSPREALAILFPDRPILGERGNESKSALAEVEQSASQLQFDLAVKYGINLTFFQLQVLLCEFKEALHGRFYFGGAHDEELVDLQKATPGFAPEDIQEIYDARKRIFKPEYLGEIGGWTGYRKEMMKVFTGAHHNG